MHTTTFIFVLITKFNCELLLLKKPELEKSTLIKDISKTVIELLESEAFILLTLTGSTKKGNLLCTEYINVFSMIRWFKKSDSKKIYRCYLLLLTNFQWSDNVSWPTFKKDVANIKKITFSILVAYLFKSLKILGSYIPQKSSLYLTDIL